MTELPSEGADEATRSPAPSLRRHRNPNRIRDHLANERTYLAWMRSGISLLGFGVLIVRIRVLSPPLAPRPPGLGWKLGLAFSMVGLLMVGLSSLHYFGVRNDIEDDAYAPPDRWVLLSTLVLLALGAFVVLYIFQVPFDGASAPVLID
ncbi:MAG: YidH family protein [Cyanobacteriota bacterium]